MAMAGEPGGGNLMVDAAREFLNFLRVERAASDNTVAAYRRSLARYLEFLGESGVERTGEVDKALLVSFASELSGEERGFAASSLAQAFSALRMFHRFLVTEGYADNDPSEVLLSPRVTQKLPRALSRKQVEALLDAPSGDEPRAVRDRLMLEMLYATGMRISELVGLDISSVDPAERVARVRGKGSKWRMVPFGEATRRTLVFYLEQARPELAGAVRQSALMLNARGGRLTRQGSWKIIKGHAAAVGMSEVVTPHVLRHTFATHMLEGGASILVVQELLGHASIATTQIYTEVTGEHLKEVYTSSHPRA
jgi:integrase/recombinase XerD